MEKEMAPQEIKAVFYNSETDMSTLVDVVIGDEASICKYLVKSNGKADLFGLEGDKYWLLESSVNGSFLLFRHDVVNRFKSAEETDITLAGIIKQF